MVLPVLCALEAHPEAGSSWSNKIESILINELNRVSPTHEPCLYIGHYANQEVPIGQHIDDFMIAALHEEGQWDLFAHLATKINIGIEPGLLSHYNHIDKVKDHEYLKIQVGKYIGKILADLIKPLHPSSLRELEETPSPSTDAERVFLESAAKFSYRNTIGKLLYAYVTFRLSIGYAMAELSNFSCGPAACH
jgi:hypothetical protein